MYYKLLYTLSIVLSSTLFLSGCHGDKKEETSQKIIFKKDAITTIMPSFGTFEFNISATASVQPSPEGMVNITAPINGTISNIKTSIGKNVLNGSPLVSIQSSDISDANSQYISAKAAYVQAKKIYEMNQEIYKLGAIADNDLSQSKTDMEQSKALMEGIAKKLAYYGAVSGEMFVLHSPIDGVIYEINTHLGEKVAPDGNALIRIANPEKKIVVATVYEKDLSAFTKGQEVQITTDNSTLKGIITYVSDVLDPETKTDKIYIQPSGNLKELRMNMFVNVIQNKKQKDVYKIPKKSILFKDGKFIVYIKQDDQFLPNEITLIRDEPNDDYSLVQGIKPNTPIALEAISLEKE